MADRKTLGIIGFILGGVTAAVMAISAIVVQSHLAGHLTLDNAPSSVASLPIVVR
jgi:hypothetical protein